MDVEVIAEELQLNMVTKTKYDADRKGKKDFLVLNDSCCDYK
jgi:hypothetical protein